MSFRIARCVRPCAAFLMLAGSSVSVWAADLNVPADFPTIQAAVNAASATGDRVLIAPGTYTEQIDLLGKAVELKSTGSAATTIIAPGALGPIILAQSINGLKLEGLTIRGGQLLTGSGAGLRVVDSTVTIVACVFDQNSVSDGDGAAISASGSTLTVSGTSFTSNTANAAAPGTTIGAAVSIIGGTAALTNCTFTSNVGVEVGGGAIGAANAASLTLTGCTFRTNQANTFTSSVSDIFGGGGAVAAKEGSSVSIISSLFETNIQTGSGGGGAVRIFGAGSATSLNVLNSTFTGNSGAGGAISFTTAGSFELRGTRFEGNVSASSNGGAILFSASGPAGIIANCSFIDNNAAVAGAMQISHPATISDCTFSGNRANGATSGSFVIAGGGGAVIVDSGSALTTFERCTFTNNVMNSGGTATNRGGAVRVRRSNVAFTDCTFTGNSSNNNRGGALWFEALSSGSTAARTGTITNCTFTNNTTTGTGFQEGGAIGAAGRVSLVITNSQFIGNTAATRGGAIDGEFAEGLTIRNTTFRDGGSRDSAGVFWNALTSFNPAIVIENSTFRNLTATPIVGTGQGGDWGGANLSAHTLQLSNTTFENCSAKIGGGLRFVANVNATTTSATVDNLTLNNCNAVAFSSSNGGDFGGAEINASTVTIRNSTVTNCDAKLYAGISSTGPNVTVEDSTFRSNTATAINGSTGGDVGALRIVSANGLARRLTFRDNAAKIAGSLQGNSTGTFTVEDCTFINSRAIATPTDSSGEGGAINTDAVNVVIRRSTFDNCSARNGGAIRIAGGSAAGTVTLSDLVFNDCDAVTTTTSTSAARGGSVFLERTGTAHTLSRIRSFSGNARRGAALWLRAPVISVTDLVAIGNAAVDRGGAVHVENSGPVSFTNALIAGNSANFGAGIFVDTPGTTPSILNSTIVDNAGAGLFLATCEITAATTATNSIIRGNTVQIFEPGCEPTAIVSSSNIQGGFVGTAVIDSDPLFANPAAGIYTLQSASPSIDAGDNTALNPTNTTDLVGAVRQFDNPATPDTGVGPAPVVDHGPYEFVGSPACPVIASGPNTIVLLSPADVTFSVSLSAGTQPLVYQWRRNGTALSSGPQAGGGFVVGANTPTLKVLNADSNNFGAYDVVITNPCGSVISSAATLSGSVTSGCNPADIACDDGTPLGNAPGCVNSATGPNEGDFNAFFAADGFFFQSGLGAAAINASCDIACDDGTPKAEAPGCVNNGVNEGDYNAFFNYLFLACS